MARMALLLALASRFASAQPLPDTVYTIGTTTVDAQGQAWAYLLWQTSDPLQLRGRTVALYAKPGDANSPALYERRSVLGLQTEPPVIQALLNRAINLGDDPGALDQRLTSLFLTLVPKGSVSTPEKLSAVIRGSLDDPGHFGNLVLLGRLHPAVNLCLGYAGAEPIPGIGLTTFEIREFDRAQGQDLAVLGRVTVDPAASTLLPAPGAPVQVPESSSKGDLNVKLRWAYPDPLKRLTLLHYGYNLYRMTRAYAEAHSYHVSPPNTDVLRGLVQTQSAQVKRLNELPVLITKSFSVADAANLALDPKTYFFADDNHRYRPGGQPFANGDAYYYFATARDVLGRDGQVSPAGYARVCDRVPPDAPNGLTVENDYAYDTGTGTTRQVLKVRWKQSTNTADHVVGYAVYRWDDPNQVQSLGLNPAAHGISAILPHVPGQVYSAYVDNGPGSPQAPADYSRTYWYTVRALDNGACDGGNYSANSAPAFGVLRDRQGPGGPTGTLGVLCCRPTVQPAKFLDRRDETASDPAFAYYEAICLRERPGVAWAEFHVFDSALSNRLARVAFLPGEAQVSYGFRLPLASVTGRLVPFLCRVGALDDEVSDYAIVETEGHAKVGSRRQVLFTAREDCQQVAFRPPVRGQGTAGNIAPHERPCGGSHTAQPPGTNTTVGVVVVINLTPGTKEFRLYRRVDNGPLTLIKQGAADFDKVTQIAVTDSDMPANAAVLCYYGQLFDEQGNASPITLLQDCVTVKVPTGKPMLAPLAADGNPSSPQLTIRWFCPPYGIERFEVYIATSLGFMPANVSSELSSIVPGTPTNKTVVIDGTPVAMDFAVYRTPAIGPAFGQGASFQVTANIGLNQKYTVFIKPVAKGDESQPDSLNSNVAQFEWSEPVAVGPQVPWPARPLPPVNFFFNAGLKPVRLPDTQYSGAALVIGVTSNRVRPRQKADEPYVIRTPVDPMNYVFTNKSGASLFPMAVYRYQVPNFFFPKISGDIVQVTPLMERIAYAVQTDASLGPSAFIYDPFVVVSPSLSANEAFANLYLLDTQPVIAYAIYGYLVVRFDANGEIREVIPTPFVDITP
jgi:hypothetical protein